VPFGVRGLFLARGAVLKGSPGWRGYSKRTLVPMKRLSLFAALSGLALFIAAAPAQTPRPRFEPLRIIDQSNLPLFPHDLIQIGVREGEARVAFSVDAAGKIEDVLPVAYTSPEFAEATVSAVRRWKFAPARFQGEPVSSSTEIRVTFEIQGTTVVSLTPSDSIASWLHSVSKFDRSYRPRLLSELDRIPTPLAAPAPSYPNQLAQQGRSGSVTVMFYIDEKGNVRLPSVRSEDDSELGALAITAVQQWKFEPPTCRRQTVLVRATQVFNFRPAPPPTAQNSR
jgi:TonB family protein